jgi:hypothetical protein
MSHKLRFDSDLGIVFIQFEGIQRVETIFKAFCEAILVAESIDSFRILWDFRNATLELSTLQIYSLPVTLSSCKPESSHWLHKYRHAILAIADDDFRFMVTMLNNRSQTAELFETPIAAQNWLRFTGAAET